MKQKSWISIVFSFASQCRGKIALSVLCAIISVVAGLIPYWSVYQIITLFIGGSPVMAEVWKWCWIGLGAYAIRFLLYGISTSLSHISAYTILENIRLTLAQRLMKAPLGTVIGESVGKLKSVLVDRVETIELPLAHMIPECISNLLLPVAVFVYLVCIDWRMALAMLVTVPLAFIAFAMMMKNFNNPGGQAHPAGLSEGPLCVQQPGDLDGYDFCREPDAGAGSDGAAAPLGENREQRAPVCLETAGREGTVCVPGPRAGQAPIRCDRCAAGIVV